MRRIRKPGLGLIGAGAFGAFCLPHLLPLFRVTVCDPGRDLAALAGLGAVPGDLAAAAAQDVVVLAVPLAALADVARAVAAHVRPGALVLDVCSVKGEPEAILDRLLPAGVDIVGTHPLFGPESGRDGLAGLRIALCPVRGRRIAAVARTLRRLGLDVAVTTAAEHDRQMAYVQGLTHLIARIVMGMGVPPLTHTTRTFDHLMRMVDTVRHDSEALFRTIAVENPFAAEVRERFFAAAADLDGALRTR